MVTTGRFISLEGTEGVGKSTNVAFICAWLSQRQIPHIATREPGGTRYGDQIRALLLDVRDEALDPLAELLLIFAARAQHLAQVIRPALAAGTWVVCDRFTDATYAYQGGGRGIDTADIAALERLVQGPLRPDLTLVLDISPALGLQRLRGRGALDRFEREQLDFFARVRAAYHERTRAAPERYRLIDAGRDIAEVQADIDQVLTAFIAAGNR